MGDRSAALRGAADGNAVTALRDVSRHHSVELGGIEPPSIG